jgi:hypothetical protein
MPFFKNQKLFFIHIPKTGGTSVENYLYKKYNYKKNINTLFTTINQKSSVKINKHSLQHMTYQEIIDSDVLEDYNLNDITFFSIVRNPYDRIVSELFYIGRINLNSSKEKIEKEIKFFINDNYLYDNHKLPQYLFLTLNKKLVKSIKVLKMETLNDDMYNYGYIDFNEDANKTNRIKINYQSLLTNNAKKIIYDYYKKDFELFNYEK